MGERKKLSQQMQDFIEGKEVAIEQNGARPPINGEATKSKSSEIKNQKKKDVDLKSEFFQPKKPQNITRTYRIEPEVDAWLDQLARDSGREKSYIVNSALKKLRSHLEAENI